MNPDGIGGAAPSNQNQAGGNLADTRPRNGGARPGGGRPRGSKTGAKQAVGVKSVNSVAATAIRRAWDDTVADRALTPVELAARDFGRCVVRDLGADMATTKLAAVMVASRGLLVVSLLDRAIVDLVQTKKGVLDADGNVRRIVQDRTRAADSLVRQLAAIGWERAAPKAPTPWELVAQIQAEAERQSAATEGARDGATSGDGNAATDADEAAQ